MASCGCFPSKARAAESRAAESEEGLRRGRSRGYRKRLPKNTPSDMVTTIQNRTKLTRTEIDLLYARFRQLAPGGSMSPGVFRGTMGMLGMLDDLFLAHRMFSAFDVDDDGKLSFVEFATALGIMIRGNDDEKLAFAFRLLSPPRSRQRHRSARAHEMRGRRSRNGTGDFGGFGEAEASERVKSHERDSSNAHQDARPPQGADVVDDEVEGITLFEFRNIVVSLDSTRRQLIGCSGEVVDDWMLEQLFWQLSSRRRDGSPVMTLSDFKRAVRTSREFLSLLGVTPGAEDRNRRYSIAFGGHPSLSHIREFEAVAQEGRGDSQKLLCGSTGYLDAVSGQKYTSPEAGTTDTGTPRGAADHEAISEPLLDEKGAGSDKQVCPSTVTSKKATVTADLQVNTPHQEVDSHALAQTGDGLETKQVLGLPQRSSSTSTGPLSHRGGGTLLELQHVREELLQLLGEISSTEEEGSDKRIQSAVSETNSPPNDGTVLANTESLPGLSSASSESRVMEDSHSSSDDDLEDTGSRSSGFQGVTVSDGVEVIPTFGGERRTRRRAKGCVGDTCSSTFSILSISGLSDIGVSLAPKVPLSGGQSFKKVPQSQRPISSETVRSPSGQPNGILGPDEATDFAKFRGTGSVTNGRIPPPGAIVSSHLSSFSPSNSDNKEEGAVSSVSNQKKKAAGSPMLNRKEEAARSSTSNQKMKGELSSALTAAVRCPTESGNLKDRLRQMLKRVDEALLRETSLERKVSDERVSEAMEREKKGKPEVPFTDQPKTVGKDWKEASIGKTLRVSGLNTIEPTKDSGPGVPDDFEPQFGRLPEAGAQQGVIPINGKPDPRDTLVYCAASSADGRNGDPVAPSPFYPENSEFPRMYMNRPNFEERTRRRQGSIAQFQQRIQRRRPEYKLLGPTKGFSVHFGHPSWNMVLNMMVGIRLAGGRINNEPRRKVETYDFIMKEKISILPQTEGGVEAPRHVEAVRFIDYAPMVFRKIREFFGINPQEYLQSLGPEQLVGNMVLGNLSSLSELCSEGKSGAFFYYSADGRFLIKTITRDAAKFFRSILKDYYEHILQNPDTLITRFFGCHAIRLRKRAGNVRAKLYFVIMGNVFHTPVEIQKRYDLKGSWVGRSTGDSAKDDSTIALKDKDMVLSGEKISIGHERGSLLLKVLERDAEFFQSHMILDYSLLVGIHYKPVQADVEEMILFRSLTRTKTQASTGGFPLLARQPTLNYNGHRKAFHQRDLGGMVRTDGQALYYLGIIDVLTRWTPIKRLEHDFKAIQSGEASGVSCIHPSLYAKRFIEFLQSRVE